MAGILHVVANDDARVGLCKSNTRNEHRSAVTVGLNQINAGSADFFV